MANWIRSGCFARFFARGIMAATCLGGERGVVCGIDVAPVLKCVRAKAMLHSYPIYILSFQVGGWM